MTDQAKASPRERFQIVWRWRSFFWPFYVCRCEEHEGDPHVVYDGWDLAYFRRPPPDWGISIVYRWILRIGPVEVRRWVPDEERAERIRAHTEASA